MKLVGSFLKGVYCTSLSGVCGCVWEGEVGRRGEELVSLQGFFCFFFFSGFLLPTFNFFSLFTCRTEKGDLNYAWIERPVKIKNILFQWEMILTRIEREGWNLLFLFQCVFLDCLFVFILLNISSLRRKFRCLAWLYHTTPKLTKFNSVILKSHKFK